MELRPYQQAAAERMVWQKRTYLAFAPRMGKTPTTIAAATRLGMERPLVICPATVRDQGVWQDHWAHWGIPSTRPEVVSWNWLYTHEGQLGQLAEAVDGVIIDEVHYAARTEAKRTTLALQIANRAPHAKGLFVLSGSPVRNRPFDLFPPLRAIWPDKLKALGVLHASNFRATFEREEWVPVPGRGKFQRPKIAIQNAPMLRALLQEIMIRVSREEVAEQLPPLAWEVEPLELPQSVLAGMERALAEVDGYEAILEALEHGEIPGEGSPAIATVRRILGTAKAWPAAQRVAEELECGLLTKVVVGAYHHDVLDLLARELEPFGVARLDGRSLPHEKAQAIADFQRGEPRVMVAQLTAAGVGIDLSAANDVILVEQSWVPDDNLQFVDRIRHPDKQHPCTAREYVVRGSVDLKVASARRRKMRTIATLYGDD